MFSTPITPTGMRPDIVWWNDEEKQLWLVELTVPFETSFVQRGKALASFPGLRTCTAFVACSTKEPGNEASKAEEGDKVYVTAARERVHI